MFQVTVSEVWSRLIRMIASFASGPTLYRKAAWTVCLGDARSVVCVPAR